MLNLPAFEFKNFYKIKRIVLFKSSVSLKRFNPRITKFKRKAIARRKHYSNRLFYLNILSKWACDFKIQKQLNKFQFVNKIFLNNAFCYNFEYIRRRGLLNESAGNESFFLFTALSKKIYNTYHLIDNRVFKIFNFAYIFTTEIDFKNTPNTLVPVCSEYEMQLFHSTFVGNLQEAPTVDFFFKHSISEILEFYKILILSFFFVLFKR